MDNSLKAAEDLNREENEMMLSEIEICKKLREAEDEESVNVRYTTEEILQAIMDMIDGDT